MSRKYFHQLAIAIDQLLNALLAGWADETISSRAWRCRDVRKWAIMVKIINGVFFWQKNHCRATYVFELTQGHKPTDFYEVRPTK